MNNMRNKKSNNMRRGGGGGHSGGGGRRYHGGGGGGGHSGGGNRNDGQNVQRQKHHATQMREKYTNMARDAQNNGDRVDVEYYLQHVDHYTRVLNDIAAIEAERFAAQRESQPANPPSEGGDANTGGSGGNANENQGNNEEPITPGNQPRMTRGPRHSSPPQQSQQQNQSNDSGEEIPLPGSALPAI